MIGYCILRSDLLSVVAVVVVHRDVVELVSLFTHPESSNGRYGSPTALYVASIVIHMLIIIDAVNPIVPPFIDIDSTICIIFTCRRRENGNITAACNYSFNII